MSSGRKVVVSSLLGAMLAVAGVSAVAAQTTSSSTSTTSTPPPAVVQPDPNAECPQPYAPQNWSWGFGGYYEGPNVSGPYGPITGDEGNVVLSPAPGATPGPPPGVVMPGPLFGAVDVPTMGRFSLYRGTVSEDRRVSVFWMVNDETALPFVMPYGEAFLMRVLANDTGVFLEASNSTRSGTVFYRWRLDAPCTPPSVAGAVNAQDVAVSASPTFTG